MVRWLRAVLVGLGVLLSVIALVPVGYAFLALAERPGEAAVRLYGYQNTVDGPLRHVMVLEGWRGLVLAGLALLGVPAAAAVASIRGPAPVYRRMALVLLAAWLGWWMIGFARMVVTFGAAADHMHILGLGLSGLGVLGLAWGALRVRARVRISEAK